MHPSYRKISAGRQTAAKQTAAKQTAAKRTARFCFTSFGIVLLASAIVPSLSYAADTRSGAADKRVAAKSSLPEKKSPERKSKENRASELRSGKLVGKYREAAVTINKSTSLLRIGKFHEALAESQKAIELCPEMSDAYAQNAICLSVLNQYGPAETSAKKAVEVDPENSNAWQAYSGVFAAQGKIPQAVDYLKKAVEVDPKSHSSWYALGQLYVMMDDARSKECFEKAVALDPKNGRYELELGYVYHGMKRYAEAEKHYRRAIKLDPQNMTPWRRLTLLTVRRKGNLKTLSAEISRLKPSYGREWQELARAYMIMGENGKALQCMNSSKACPQDLSAHGLVQTAEVYLDLQKWSEAEKLLKKAETISPSTSHIKKLISVVYSNTNRTAEAIKYMRLATYMDPKNPELLADLSTLLMESDLKESESVALKAVNIKPNSPFLLSHLAAVLSRRNKIKEALKYAHMAEQLNPPNAETWHRITCAQIYAKDLQAAKISAEKAISCDPSSFMSWFNLGVVYYDDEQWKPALDALNRSIELNPAHCATWEILSYVRRGLNDTKGAEDAFRKAVALAPNEQKRFELAKYRSAKNEKKATLRGILLPQLRTADAPSSKL